MSDTKTAPPPLFNTPLEAALRSLILLESVEPNACDLQRLVTYDYLLVHSGDLPDSPASLHPASPLRASELLVRRKLVEGGLELLVSKGLVKKVFSHAGVLYAATTGATQVLALMTSPYAKRCIDIAHWISPRFQPLAASELQAQIARSFGRWGAEFTNEPTIDRETE